MTPEEAKAEAVRRIRHARETNTEILDLGDLPLDEVPEEIERLPIRVLSLGWGIPRIESGELKWKWNIKRSIPRINNIDALSKLTALTSLDLSGCRRLSNVKALSELIALTSLDLSWCICLPTVDGLSRLTALSSLDLRVCCRLKQLDGLSNLTALTSLNLSGVKCRVAFRPFWASLPCLTELRLCQSSFLDLPSEICGENHEENVIDAVRAYFDDRPHDL